MQNKTDGELIAQFATDGQAEAFEELVRRHGPMVQSVCSRVLGHRTEGEDVTQVVFLILAQKAGELRDRASLAGWLHRVAWHTSLRTRRSSLIRRRHERAAADVQARSRQQTERDLSLQLELDRVLNLVPEVYREPLVLHYLEGLSLEESAQLMECPIGTVASRLARGREMLRVRLERWGLALTVATGGELLLHEIGVEGFVATVVVPAGPVTGGITAMSTVAERSTSLAVPAGSAAALTTAGVGLYGVGAGFCGGSAAVSGYGFGPIGAYAAAMTGICGSAALGIGGSSAWGASMGASAGLGTSVMCGGLVSLCKSVTAGTVVAWSLTAAAMVGVAASQSGNQPGSSSSAPAYSESSPAREPSYDSSRDWIFSSSSGSFSSSGAVPEPSSLVTFLAASLSMLLRQRRR